MAGQLVLYVGKTKDKKRRECEHRNKRSHCSQQIPDYTDWILKVLEETTDALGTEREQYYYDTLNPLYNHNRPGQTKKENSESDAGKATLKAYSQSEAGKVIRKAYRQSEAGKAYQKAYYQSHKKLKSIIIIE